MMIESLPEVLHSLQVDSSTCVRPKQPVSFTFSFANRGFAAAVPRLRVHSPAHAIEWSHTLTVFGEEKSPLAIGEIAGAGVDLPAVPAGGEVRVRLDGTIGAKIEDLESIPVQVEVFSGDESVGSNIVRLLGQSEPDVASSTLTFEAEDHAAYATLTVKNTGAATARGVRAEMRVPLHAAVAGSESPDEHGTLSLDLGDVASGARLTRRVAFAVTEPGTSTLTLPPVMVRGSNCAAVVLPGGVLTIGAPALEATLHLSASTLAPGGRVQAVLTIVNSGDAATGEIAISGTLGGELHYVPSSALQDESPIIAAKSRRTQNAFPDMLLSPIPPRSRTVVTLDCQVDSRAKDGSLLSVTALVQAGEHLAANVEAEAIVSAQPRFGAGSTVAIDRRAAKPGEVTSGVISVVNEGTTTATMGVVTLSGAYIAEVEGFEAAGDGRWTFSLRSLECRKVRIIPFAMRLVDVIPDGARSTIAVLVRAKGTGDHLVGEIPVDIVSSPLFSEDSAFTVDDASIGADDVREIVITATNAGSDVARGARAEIAVPDVCVVEPPIVDLGDVAPGTSATGTAFVRLRTPLADDCDLPLRATLHAQNHPPYMLRSQVIRSTAEAAFAGELIAALPSVNVGETLDLTCSFENTGDGNARGLTLTAEAIPGTSFVPGSLRVNNHPIVTRDPDAPLASPLETTGLVFRLVRPKSQIQVAWKVQIVGAPAAYFTPHVRAAWGDGKSLIVSGDAVAVRAKSAFGALGNDVTFVLDEDARRPPAQPMLSTSIASAQSAAGERKAQEPAAAQDRAPDGQETGKDAILEAETRMPPIAEVPIAMQVAPEAPVPPAPLPPTGLPADADFNIAALLAGTAAPLGVEPEAETLAAIEPASPDPSPESEGAVTLARLERTLDARDLARIAKYLKSCGGRGLVTHVIALSRLLPNRILSDDGECVRTFDVMMAAVRESIDGLFIRSTIGGYTPAPSDLESRAMRSAIEQFATTLNERAEGEADGVETEITPVLFTRLRPDAFAASADRLAETPIGSIATYQFLTMCLPNEGVAPIAPAFAEYRAQLMAVLDSADDLDFATYIAEVDTTTLDAALGAIVDALAERHDALVA